MSKERELLKTATYDNPTTMRRESWVDGELSAWWCASLIESNNAPRTVKRWNSGYFSGNLEAIPASVLLRALSPNGAADEVCATCNGHGLVGGGDAGGWDCPDCAADEDREAVIACLGDDAAAIRNDHPEVATNMELAARMLETSPPAAVERQAAPVDGRMWLVCTGIVHEDTETYTLHLERPPLCDAEAVYLAPPQGAEGFREPGIEDVRAMMDALPDVEWEALRDLNFLSALKSAGCMFPEKAR